MTFQTKVKEILEKPCPKAQNTPPSSPGRFHSNPHTLCQHSEPTVTTPSTTVTLRTTRPRKCCIATQCGTGAVTWLPAGAVGQASLCHTVFFLGQTGHLVGVQSPLTLLLTRFHCSQGKGRYTGQDMDWWKQGGCPSRSSGGPSYLPLCQDVQGAQSNRRPWKTLPESVQSCFIQR